MYASKRKLSKLEKRKREQVDLMDLMNLLVVELEPDGSCDLGGQ